MAHTAAANDPLVLKDIVSRAWGILHRIGSPAPRPTLSATPTLLSLPEPLPITSDLLLQGLKPAAAKLLSEAYVKKASELRRKFEQSMTHVVDTYLGSTPSSNTPAHISAIKQIYQVNYERELRHWAALGMTMSSKRAESLHAVADSRHKRPAYNHETIPQLESMFIRNAYPSRAQKLALAEQTGMEFKQVHIWFQNRRNRAKKVCKDQHKTVFVSSPDSEVLSPYGIPNHFGHYDLHPTPSLRSPDDSFTFRAPSHAFPMPYPPVCDKEPFPAVRGPGVLDTPWPRYASQSSLSSNGDAADITTVTEALRKLTVAGASSDIARHTNAAGLSTGCTSTSFSCFPMLTKPPLAPLPALTRATVDTRSKGSSSSSAKHQALHDLGHNQQEPMNTLIHGGRSSLLRRVPRSSQVQLRDAWHPYVMSTSRKRSRRLSSASSLSSILSLDSNMSTTSSSSSLDSPLATPPQLSVNLPYPSKLSSSAFILDDCSDLGRSFNSVPASPRPYEWLLPQCHRVSIGRLSIG